MGEESGRRSSTVGQCDSGHAAESHMFPYLRETPIEVAEQHGGPSSGAGGRRAVLSVGSIHFKPGHG